MRLVLVGILMALVTGCQTALRSDEICAADPNSTECLCSIDADSEQCRCSAEPTLPGCLCVLQPQLPQCQPKPPCPDTTARTHVREGLLLLSDGGWEPGRRRLECALEAEPGSTRADRGCRTSPGSK